MDDRPGHFREAAGDGQIGGAPKLGPVPDQRPKINPFGVAKEPGGLVVGGLGPAVEAGAPERHLEPVALGADPAAGRGIRHWRNLGPGSGGTSPLYL